MLAKVFKMLSQGKHQINEKILQNSQHFALCWQAYSLEKLWLFVAVVEEKGRERMRVALWGTAGKGKGHK